MHGMRSMEHLVGMQLPPLALPSTTGGEGGWTALSAGRSVVYLYPGDDSTPEGPQAEPSSCAVQRAIFRDYALDFAAEGARIAGLSSEPHETQVAAAERERLPFPLISDRDCHLADALELPTFLDFGVRRFRRLTLICEAGVVAAAFYPVSPRRSAAQALGWLNGFQPG